MHACMQGDNGNVHSVVNFKSEEYHSIEDERERDAL